MMKTIVQLAVSFGLAYMVDPEGGTASVVVFLLTLFLLAALMPGDNE